MRNNKLLAYTIDFVSFLVERIDLSSIKKIILFGSVARNEATEESDVDIFIDTVGTGKIIKTAVKSIESEFYKSQKYLNYWHLKNIKNEINLIVGNLDEWSDLKSSIIANGITLYGKFEELPSDDGAIKTLFSWQNIKPESKRVLLSKKLFGYVQNKKKYAGIVAKYDCEQIGKGTILVPSEHANILLSIFRKLKIAVKMKRILEYRK